MNDNEKERIHEALLLGLNEFKLKVDSGNNLAIISAFRYCIMNDLDIPDWLGDAFMVVTNKFFSLECKGLDEAFGTEWPKGMHINTARKKRKYKLAVYNFITNQHDKGKPIDVNMFECAGTKFNLSASTARDYYYEAKAMLTIKLHKK